MKPDEQRILIVDDNPVELRITSSILKKQGYRISEAKDGKEALKQVREFKPHLVLLDVVLPDLSGLEVLKRCRQDPDLGNISIVLLSSLKLSADEQAEGLNAGSDGYIARPVGNSELLARVQMHLKHRFLSNRLIAGEKRFRNLITQLADGILVIDNEGVIRLANPSAVQLFQRPEDELIGRTFGFPVIDKSAQEISLMRSNGTSVQVEMRTASIDWEDSQAWVVSFNDITQRQRLAEERKNLIHALGERVKEQRLLYKASALMQQENLEFEELTERLVRMIPQAFQYPETAAARVVIGEIERASEGFQGTKWILSKAFRTADGMEGRIEVVYLEELPEAADGPFLQEEIELINALAEMFKAGCEHRVMIRAIRDSEHRYRSIFELVPVSIWREDWSAVIAMFKELEAEAFHDLHGYLYSHPHWVERALEAVQILDVNQATLQMFEAESKSELMGSLATVFSTPDTLTGFIGELTALGHGKSLYESEMSLRTVKGNLIHVLLGMSFPGKDDKSGEVLVSLMDVTAIKNARQRSSIKAKMGRELAKSTSLEAASRIILSAADEMLGWDAAWIDDYNPATRERIFSIKIDTVDGIKKEIPTLYEKDDPSETISRAVAEGGLLINREPDDVNLNNLKTFGDTQRRSVSLLFAPIKSNEAVLAVLSIQSYAAHKYTDEDLNHLRSLADYGADALTRIRAQNAKAQSDARFEAVFQSSPTAIFIADVETGALSDVNAEFCRIIKMPREELMGRSLKDLPLWEDAKAWANINQQLTQSDSIKGMETRIETRSKEVLDVIVSMEKLVLPGEDQEVLLAQFMDVSNQKKLEKQFFRSQRLESIGVLAGGIAHDLNNVFAPILMSADLLEMDAKDATAKEIIRTIQISAKRGADMVHQILSFSRGQKTEPKLINIRHILADVQKIIRETFPKNIQFELRKPEDLWLTHADPTQLHQVFVNLCVNARDAMPNGGKLSITVRNHVIDEIYTHMNPDLKPGPHVVVEVTDTGQGMTREVQDRVFDPFFTTKKIGEGTGLGLSTSLGIVKSHKGSINVYSELHRGTTFKVYLPAEAEEKDSEQIAVRQTGLPRGMGEVVLLIDDEEQVRKVVSNTLERFGYRVITACHGAEAVSIYARQKKEVAVVITDMAMPVMDGPSTIIALRSMNPSVKIIGSSGHEANGLLTKAIGAGVDKFIPKPYSAEAILKTLAEVLATDS